jgi:hypothetical protein
MPQCLRNKNLFPFTYASLYLDEGKLYYFPTMTFSTDLDNSCVAAQKRAALV